MVVGYANPSGQLTEYIYAKPDEKIWLRDIDCDGRLDVVGAQLSDDSLVILRTWRDGNVEAYLIELPSFRMVAYFLDSSERAELTAIVRRDENWIEYSYAKGKLVVLAQHGTVPGDIESILMDVDGDRELELGWVKNTGSDNVTRYGKVDPDSLTTGIADVQELAEGVIALGRERLISAEAELDEAGFLGLSLPEIESFSELEQRIAGN